MYTGNSHDLGGLGRALASAKDALFAVQHFWPLALVAGVLLWAGGAFVYGALFGSAPGRMPAPVVTTAGGGVAATTTASAALSAALSVASDPSGATVVVDGDSVGTTPLGLGGLHAGDYRITVLADGFVTADTLVQVRDAEGVAVALHLQPVAHEPRVPAEITVVEAQIAPPPTTPRPAAAAPRPAEKAEGTPRPAPAPPAEGTVEVSVIPWGTIEIDGTVRRRDTDVAFEASLAPGSHRVRVEHPTLGAREKTVRVRSGQTARLTFDLNTPGSPP